MRRFPLPADTTRGSWSAGLERGQVVIYLLAMAAGALLGLAVPETTPIVSASINPLLVLLLYATFLTVPFARLRAVAADRRFTACLLVVNFLVMPVIVWALTRPIASDSPILLGALLVLLCPCVDWVVAFTRLAGGDHARILAATPLLMAIQVLALPGCLALMAGPAALSAITWWPFARSFLVLIALPLAASILTRALEDRHDRLRSFNRLACDLMVVVLAAVLAAVVASQINDVVDHLPRLARLMVVYLAFAVIAPGAGIAAGRAAGCPAPARRALAVCATARNSLVVLPLALSLPDSSALAAAAVVTQTLVELVVMVALVGILPLAVEDRPCGTGDPVAGAASS